ncbi:MAG: hypothetical protein KIT57_03665 [Blastocatellales bacterium]|nr:hypothetical protein [Blastocatellales bacterium]
MTLDTLLDELQERGIELTPAGDRLRYRAPQGALTPELKQAIAERKPELLAILGEKHAPTEKGRCPVCGEHTVVEVVRERFVHSYCAEPRHYDHWSTTDGERFGDLSWMIVRAE